MTDQIRTGVAVRSVEVERRIRAAREWLALRIAPWLYFHNRDAAEDAFRDLAELAYGSRDAIWTSHRTLVKTALKEAHRQGRYPRIPT